MPRSSAVPITAISETTSQVIFIHVRGLSNASHWFVARTELFLKFRIRSSHDQAGIIRGAVHYITPDQPIKRCHPYSGETRDGRYCCMEVFIAGYSDWLCECGPWPPCLKAYIRG